MSSFSSSNNDTFDYVIEYPSGESSWLSLLEDQQSGGYLIQVSRTDLQPGNYMANITFDDNNGNLPHGTLRLKVG